MESYQNIKYLLKCLVFLNLRQKWSNLNHKSNYGDKIFLRSRATVNFHYSKIYIHFEIFNQLHLIILWIKPTRFYFVFAEIQLKTFIVLYILLPFLKYLWFNHIWTGHTKRTGVFANRELQKSGPQFCYILFQFIYNNFCWYLFKYFLNHWNFSINFRHVVI